MIIETAHLILRDWKDSDRDLFREINRDSKVMEFFPFRRSHEEADALMERITGMIGETGLGFYAVELKESGEPIGFCGLSNPLMPEIFPQGTVEVGWRLATRYWGNGYATQAANALLAFGFQTKNLPEIVSFAVAGNHRSTAVMKRIGMTHDPDRDFDHPRVPDTYAHLKRHVVYALTHDDWLQRNHGR